MDVELNQEQQAFAQVAREFAQGDFAPNAARWDQECIFPVGCIDRLRGVGGSRSLDDCVSNDTQYGSLDGRYVGLASAARAMGCGFGKWPKARLLLLD